ncbi:S9 family peptidase [Erythrobacter sp. SCSIO 43205]|uniref:S9 family peptidase n=1 Tax=Erythrobacter sp. SCSIO 43205 TaxID=2779361 RepID=UPI001CA937E1|nr:prolyl oligopeptidase family serine peptidase [Erythrobacter sp. SCSIO 43205]UAB78762.1 S9 family peptidase [Erythrobacter sp. SCSIO 43205]
MSSPRISPDGERLVFSQLAEGKTYLTVRNLADDTAFSKALPKDSELNWLRWAGSGKVLLSVSSLKQYRGQRRGLGDEFQQTELYLLDTATQSVRYIGPERVGPDGDNVLHLDDDGKFLVMTARESIYKYPSVFRIDLETGESEKLIDEHKRVWRWVTDTEGVVRMGYSFRRSSTLVYYRSSEDEDFKRIEKIKDKDVIDDEVAEPLFDGFIIVAGSDDGYVLTNADNNHFSLHHFNLLTSEIGEEVFSVPGHDLSRFRVDAEGALSAAIYTDSRDRIKWFDPVMEKHQAALERAMKGQEVWITSHSDDYSRMVVFTTSPQDPGSFYLFEPNARRLDRFGGVNDQIDPNLMATTTYETYTARDGTKIPAYLTLPSGVEPANLPLIINPHGGPYGVRNTMDFDARVQFLANRGYAVLQPNYRGSGGYGKDFVTLGEGEIGRAMQDDLDDGMDWLVSRGIIDPARVCIMGSSYGGYAALWGVTRNPERYRCAASFAGVTDFDRQLRFDRDYFKHRYASDFRERVRGEDDFNMDDVSPKTMVHQLQRPVLLAHGKLDSRVPYTQFTVYKDSLEDVGADAVFVTYEEEGHGFTDKDNRKDWLDQLEAFLKKHNPSDRMLAAGDTASHQK